MKLEHPASGGFERPFADGSAESRPPSPLRPIDHSPSSSQLVLPALRWLQACSRL